MISLIKGVLVVFLLGAFCSRTSAAADEINAPVRGVTCLVWNATGHNFGHIGIYTGKYYISLWPDCDLDDYKRFFSGGPDLGGEPDLDSYRSFLVWYFGRRELTNVESLERKLKVLDDGVDACLHYHPFLDRSYEDEVEPVQYKITNVCERRIDFLYEDMLRFNDIDPESVTFVEGERKRDLYGETRLSSDKPEISLKRTRWSSVGQHLGDDPYNFYRRKQSCATFVLSLLRAGDDVVNGLSFDDIVLHHTTDHRRVLNDIPNFLKKFFPGGFSIFAILAQKLKELRPGRLSILAQGITHSETGGLLSIPNFVGIIGEWNARSNDHHLEANLVGERNWNYVAPADYDRNILGALQMLQDKAKTKGIAKISDVLARCSIITRLNVSKLEIGDSGCQALALLTSLTWLNLYDNRVTDTGAEHLSRIEGLTYLDLGWNGVGEKLGIEALGRLPNLRSLSLYRNPFSKHMKTLGGMRNLVTLNLRWTNGDNVEDRDVITLVHPRQDLPNNPVLLEKLENFSLKSSNVTDRCIDFLLKLPNLKRIDIRDTSISFNGIKRLKDKGIEVMNDKNGNEYPYIPEIAGGAMSLNTNQRVHGGHFLFS